jgi:alpha-methylacyl-CoA racemase
MEGTDICFAPVLSPYEAIQHPHNVARKTFVDVQGVIQPGPAPRFSRTQPEIQGPPPTPFEKTESVLSEWGLSSEEIEDLKASEVI